uniref:DJ-1/PfpI domain-containing protein n=1 Tax=Trichogramma kaykai TaxID=54128 RepID=A0ABD2VVM0_9HYME
MDHNRKKPVEHDHPSAGERYINLEAQRLFHREQDRVQCIDSLIPSNYEALFIPGGQGVINYMLLARGEPFRPPVPTFKNIIERFIADKKPIGTISSGGIVVATVYKMIGYENFYYTMGSRGQHQILSRRPTPYWNRQSCHIPNQTLHNEYQFSTEEPHRLLIGRPPSQKVDSGPRRLSPPKKGKVAVLLNGCGGSDGSNVCETVCLANQLSLFGFSPIFFAPNYLITQNLEGETSSNPSDSQITGMRHSQAEAARLSLRRYVQNVNNLRLGDYLALIIPGSQYYTN